MGETIQTEIRSGRDTMRKEVKKQKVLRFMADFETLTGRDVVDETYVWAS